MTDIYLLLLLLDNNPKFKTFEGNVYDDLHVGGAFSDGVSYFHPVNAMIRLNTTSCY